MNMKHNSSTIHKAVAAIVTIAAFCLSAAFPAAAEEHVFAVKILDAAIKSTAGIDGNCTVSLNDDTVTPHLGVFTMPGSYAEIEVKIQNTGRLDATLAQVDAPHCSLEDFSVTLADGIEGETLKAGEICTLTVVVSWEKKSTRSFEELTEGNYAFRLIYTAEEEPATAPVPGGNDAKSVTSPAATPDAANGAQSDSAVKTGAVTAVSVLMLFAVAAGYVVIKLKAKEE